MVRVDISVLLHFSGPDCIMCECPMLLDNEKTKELTEGNPVVGLQTGANGECVFKGIFFCPECGDEIDGVAILNKAWLLG